MENQKDTIIKALSEGIKSGSREEAELAIMRTIEIMGGKTHPFLRYPPINDLFVECCELAFGRDLRELESYALQSIRFYNY